MESNMVNENIKLIKGYFLENLAAFKLENEAFYGPYWDVSYILDEIRIKIRGDIGFEITIELFGTKYSLWQYDRKVNDAMKTTQENLLYQLSVLSSFLKDTIA